MTYFVLIDLMIPLQINWYIPNFVKQQQLPTGDVTVEEKVQLGEVVKLEPKEEGEEGEAVKGETKADASLAAGEAVALKEEDEAMDGGGGGADSVKVEPQTDEGAIVSGIDDELPSAADGDDELRLDDEEEEEDLESEERSWRR